MSDKSTLRRILLSLGLGLFGLIAFLSFYHSDLQDTFKWKSLKPTNELIVRTHKLKPPLEVTLTSNVDTPISIDTDFAIRAHVSTDQRTPNLRFRWLIPEGVILTSGSLQGALKVHPRKDTEFEIHLLNKTSENKIIHLAVENGRDVIMTTQFHTQNERAIREHLIELEKRQRELYLNGQSKGL